jgi:SAM-dependent methyltransferase
MRKKAFDRAAPRIRIVYILHSATWDTTRKHGSVRLYAGGLYRGLPQFHTHIGISPFESSTKNINHDLRQPMPLANNSVDIFQSEDVFEHIPYVDMPPIIEEVFRVLKSGGLFRLSVPDYRCDVMLNRALRGSAGEPIFDPGGGGAFVDGKVVDGGHVWFPVYETVKVLLDQSSFATKGTVRFLHYTAATGKSVLNRSLMIASLRYLDHFVKRDGRWYFKQRKLMVDWIDNRPFP